MSKQIEHYNQWEVGHLLEIVVNPLLESPMHEYGRIYKIPFGKIPNNQQYEIIIENFPTYTCLDFMTTIPLWL